MRRSLWVLVLLTAVLSISSVPVHAASVLNFPRLSFETGTITGAAIANLNNSAATVTLTAFDSTGAVIQGQGIRNPVMINIGANQQYSEITSTIFGSGIDPATIAWFQATSNSDNLTGFFLFLNPTVTFFDGADLPPLARRLIFQEVRLDSGFSTEINIINPNTGPASVALQLVGGQSPLNRDVTIPARGVRRLDVADFFSVQQIPAAAYVTAASNVDIGGFEFVRGPGDLLGQNAQPASLLLSTLYFPQLAVLSGINTQLLLENGSAETVAVTIEAHQPDGTLFGSDRIRENPVTRVLTTGEVLREDVAQLFGFMGQGPLDGWIKVETNSNAVNGSVSYSIPSVNSLAAVSSQAQGVKKAVFSHIATTLGFFTGIAVLNPGTVAANVRIVALRRDGTTLGAFSTTLRPGQRISRLISEPDIIPQADGQGGGLIYVESNVPIYLTSLFGSIQSGVLANIPAQPAPASYQPAQNQPRLIVNPPLAVVQPNAVQNFQLQNSSGAITWRVNGITGGNNQLGTINTTGQYRAPATLPASLPVTVTAESANQTAGASIDVLLRQTLVSGLGVIQSVTYLEGQQRLYSAELLGAAAGTVSVQDSSSPQQSSTSTIFDVTPGGRRNIRTFQGEVPKIIGYTGIDDREYLLLAARTLGQVIRLDPTNGNMRTVASGLSQPVSLVRDTFGGIIVAQATGGLVFLSDATLNQGITAATDSLRLARQQSEPQQTPSVQAGGIAVDQCTGEIYLSVPAQGQIVVLRNGAVVVVAGGLQNPGQILAFYREGVSCPDSLHLLVVEQGANRVSLVVPAEGNVVPWINSTGVRDVAFLPSTSQLAGNEGVLLAEVPAGNTGQVSLVEVPGLYEAGATNPTVEVSHSSVQTFSSSAAFLAAISGFSNVVTETFEQGFNLGQIIATGSTFNGLTYLSFPSVTQGGRITNRFNSVSPGMLSLGVVRPGNVNPNDPFVNDFFRAGESFTVQFDQPVFAAGIFFNINSSSTLRDYVFVDTPGGSAFSGGPTPDTSTLFFVGVVSSTPFSAATFGATAVTPGGFNVDNLIRAR